MFKITSTSLACLFMFANLSSAQSAVDFREALQMTFPATVSVTTHGNEAHGALRNHRLPRMDMLGNVLNGAAVTPSIKAGFAISADKVIAQLEPGVDEVTVTTIDQTEHVGKVIARDHVTGLGVVKVDDVQLVSLVVGAVDAQPGLPVVVTWLENGVGRSHHGMIASPLNASQSQFGFTQHIDSAGQMRATGAPVVDSTGVLVGLTVAGNDGAIVCLPPAQLNRLMDSAMDAAPQDLRRGMAGIRFSTDIGPVVSGVSDDSPAAEAGLQSGDLITQINDFKVDSYHDVIAAVAMARAGDPVQVTIDRGDETLARTLTLADHPERKKVTLSALPDADDLQGNMQVHQQAWQLKDGKLVPMDLDQDGGADIMLPQQFQQMFKGLQGGDFRLPQQLRRPRRFDGLQVERSDTEEAIRSLEAERERQAAKIKELTDKINELENR